MTNTELKSWSTTPMSLRCLSELDRQRVMILKIVTQAAECPNCQNPVTQIEASGKPLDDFDLDTCSHKFACPHCKTELVEVVPFQPSGTPYRWRRKTPANRTYSESRTLVRKGRNPVEYRRAFGRPQILDLEHRELKADGTANGDEWFTVSDTHLRDLHRTDDGRPVVEFFARMADMTE